MHLLKRISFIVFLAFSMSCFAQKHKAKGKQKEKETEQQSDLDQYTQRIPQLVSFLEFSFNTLGNDSASIDDKEAIINSSYQKVFRDEKVQIEDDLIEGRSVVTYKSVQSYLRDIDYFFKNVKFKYNIENVSSYQNDQGATFFKVKLTRELKGITIDGESITNIRERNIELNIDQKKREIKIVSIYTSNLNEEQELQNWWKNLNSGWKTILKKEAGLSDTSSNPANLAVAIERLDISNHKEISDLAPLSKLEKLKYLNISGTSVSSLLSIRNLAKLEILNLSNTNVSALDPMVYSGYLKELYFENAPVSNVEPIKNFLRLEKLIISRSKINSLEFVSGLQNLKEIECSGLSLNSLKGIEALNGLEKLIASRNLLDTIPEVANLLNLQILDISENSISTLAPTQHLDKLRIINCNNTAVSSLSAVKELKKLEKVYCEKTKVSKSEASEFMRIKQGVLVIYESENLLEWWSGVDLEWRGVFRKYIQIGQEPSKEELAAIINLNVINVADNKNIHNLDPLSNLKNLKELNISGTEVSDLKPLEELYYLQQIEAVNSKVNSLESLRKLSVLKRLNIDGAKVNLGEIKHFVQEKPGCLVIYRTTELTAWWTALPKEWKQVLLHNIKLNKPPGTDQLHALANKDSLDIDGPEIKEISPLAKFSFLRVIRITNTQVQDINPLKELINLQGIYINKAPLKDLSPLSNFAYLKVLDLANTPVDDLSPLIKLKSLEVLKISGTQVKKVKKIRDLSELKVLDFSNTRVSNLRPLKNLKKLKNLVVFNSDVSKRKIRRFKKDHPDCQVVYY